MKPLRQLTRYYSGQQTDRFVKSPPLGARRLAVLIVITVFFLSFLPFEFFNQLFESRYAKQGIWLILIFSSLLIAIPQVREADYWSPSRQLLWASYCCLGGYAAVYAIFSPPLLNYNQLIGMALLVPVFSFLGLAVSRWKATVLYAILGMTAIYVAIAVIVAVSGNAETDSHGFRPLIPSALLELKPHYQNATQHIVLFSLLICFWLVRSISRKWLQALLILAAAVALFMATQFGGRAALISVVLAAFFQAGIRIVQALMQFRTARERLPAITRPLVGALLFTVVVVAPLVVTDSPALFRLSVAYNSMSSDLGAGEFTEATDPTYRKRLFTLAIQEWLQNTRTVVIGNGPQTFNDAFDGQPGEWYYPHNLFLEALAEYGLLGLSLIIIPILVLAWAVFKALKYSTELKVDQLAMLTTTAFYYSIAMVTGGLHSMWVLVFLTAAALPSNSR
ncbi:MAG: hypothetical protein KDI63_11745 [Gammaproteobacteria bacterium]|nr:hypothetical protein [Gammaproteobacteria bacterium]